MYICNSIEEYCINNQFLTYMFHFQQFMPQYNLLTTKPYVVMPACLIHCTALNCVPSSTLRVMKSCLSYLVSWLWILCHHRVMNFLILPCLYSDILLWCNCSSAFFCLCFVNLLGLNGEILLYGIETLQVCFLSVIGYTFLHIL